MALSVHKTEIIAYLNKHDINYEVHQEHILYEGYYRWHSIDLHKVNIQDTTAIVRNEIHNNIQH